MTYKELKYRLQKGFEFNHDKRGDMIIFGTIFTTFMKRAVILRQLGQYRILT